MATTSAEGSNCSPSKEANRKHRDGRLPTTAGLKTRRSLPSLDLDLDEAPRTSPSFPQLYLDNSPSPDEQKKFIRLAQIHYYNEQSPHNFQVESVQSLLQGRHAFVSVPTGRGKTRVAELWHRFQPGASIVITIIPTDLAGTDQVAHKEALGLKAAFFNSDTWSKTVAENVKRGKWQFLYLSPELFNGEIFKALMLDPRFKAMLKLLVVDEAQVVWEWGLVRKLGKLGRSVSLHGRSDNSAFRKDYSNLGSRIKLLSCSVLFLSGSCPPQAVQVIIETLHLSKSDVDHDSEPIVNANSRRIRGTLQHPTKSGLDASRIIDGRLDPSTTPKSIIFSPTIRLTGVVNEALHHTSPTHNAPTFDSDLCRRFHSVTPLDEKTRCTSDFAANRVPMVSATCSFGMAVDIPDVRLTLVLGATEPGMMRQYGGRGGRSLQPSLSISLRETKAKTTLLMMKEKMDDAGWKEEQMSPDEAMVAAAFTDVCLRVADVIYFRDGYIPMDEESDVVITEFANLEAKYGRCRCSSCDPEGAEQILSNLHLITESNFDEAYAVTGSDTTFFDSLQPQPPSPQPASPQPLSPRPPSLRSHSSSSSTSSRASSTSSHSTTSTTLPLKPSKQDIASLSTQLEERAQRFFDASGLGSAYFPFAVVFNAEFRKRAIKSIQAGGGRLEFELSFPEAMEGIHGELWEVVEEWTEGVQRRQTEARERRRVTAEKERVRKEKKEKAEMEERKKAERSKKAAATRKRNAGKEKRRVSVSPPPDRRVGPSGENKRPRLLTSKAADAQGSTSGQRRREPFGDHNPLL